MIGDCPLCGAPNASCGQSSTSVGVDELIEEAVVGGPLRVYDVVLPNGTRAQMQLNEYDAKRYNASPIGGLSVQNKMRAPETAPRKRGRKPLPRDEHGRIIRGQVT